MKPIMSIDYWLLYIICTFGNSAFCEYIISDISVSHFKAEIKSEGGGGGGKIKKIPQQGVLGAFFFFGGDKNINF